MIILSQQMCQSCGVKLTTFEVQEKDGYCMECFHETQSSTKPKQGSEDIFAKKKNTRKYAWYYHHQARTAGNS